MAIYEMKTKSYNAYRVAVIINGEQRQTYFGLSKCKTAEQKLEVYDRAAKLDKQWQEEHQKHKEDKKAKAIPINRVKTVSATDVRGVRMFFIRRQRKSGKPHVIPAFYVHTSEGEKYCGVIKVGHKKGWLNAINTYCDLKGIEKDTGYLLNKIPSKSKWEDVRRHYMDNLGWDMPEIQIKD